LKFKPSSLKFEDPFCSELIGSMDAIAQIQEQNGIQGCQRYIISNCQSAIDIVRVYQLAKLILGKGETLPLDIVPLFETIDDLAHARDIMEEMYSIPAYREHLASRSNRQTIMLGFSDGTKDGGYLRANWSIYRAKESLTAVTRRFGLKAIFFDGRGGPPDRAGRPETYEAAEVPGVSVRSGNPSSQRRWEERSRGAGSGGPGWGGDPRGWPERAILSPQPAV
jgi:phosphoenolpyruvate carboxylase